MSFLTYKLIHILGVLALFLSLGGLVALRLAPSSSSAAAARLLRMVHGVSLALVFVAGFGLMARLGIMTAWPAWIWLKLAVWLALGGLVVLVRRSEASARALLVVFLALGSLAAWAALAKF
jgi:uncharacterized membrane protein SirB2